MPLENIQLFKVQLLRAIAHLYKHFPMPTTIDHATLLKGPEKTGDGSVIVHLEDDGGTEGATILWIYNQGFIAGNLQQSNPNEGPVSAAVTNAQLSAGALRILQAAEPNANGVPLGEFAVMSAFNPSEETIAADLLFKRLV